MRIKFEIDAKKASALPFVVAWAIMLVLAGVSFLTAFLSLGPWAPVLQFSISATHAAILFVMFMRVKEGPSIKRVCAVTGFFWLLFLFGLA